MKTKFLIFSLAVFISYGTVWAQLTSYGDLNQGSAGDFGDSGSYFGDFAGLNSTGDDNTFIGYQSGVYNGSHNKNTFLGHISGHNSQGNFNTFLGASTGITNDGNCNTFVGYESGYSNNNGSHNTYLGCSSGPYTPPPPPVPIGESPSESEYRNLVTIGNGSHNTFLGSETGTTGTGSSNTFAGRQSGQHNTGSYNTFLGRYSGRYNTANFNTFIGYGSGWNNNATSNTFLGAYSGYYNTTGGKNTFIGYQSGRDNTTGGNNTYLGYQSGLNNETGSGNIFIGYRAGRDEMGSDLLYIDNSNTSAPLIWGDFENDILRFNSEVRLPMVQPGDDMTTDRVLMTSSSDPDGTVVWRNLGDIGGADNLGDHIATLNIVPGDPAIRENPNDNMLDIGENGNAFRDIYFDGSLFVNDTEFLHTRESNVAIGNNTLSTVMAGGNLNVAVGDNALSANTTGGSNVAIGYEALDNSTTGDNNMAIGRRAMFSSNVEADDNVAIGFEALFYNQTGDGNIAIGSSAGPIFGSTNLQNTIAIGHNVTVSNDNEIRLGNLEVDGMGAPVQWTIVSDGRFKINVEEDVAGLDFINSLRPVSYNLDRRKIRDFMGTTDATNSDVSKKMVGFIAQEVEQAVEENNYVFTGVKTPGNEKDHYGLKYAEFVVPLTKAVQELSTMVEALQEENAALRERMDALDSKSSGTESSVSESANTGTKNTEANGFKLYQNIPNPFETMTTVKAVVPESVQQAGITIYNLQGLELESHKLSKRGNVSIDISVGHFPSGMYLYALIADGKVIDTKKMILKR